MNNSTIILSHFLYFRQRCQSAWSKLRLSPMFGCICPGGSSQKQTCDRVFKAVNGNPCIGKLNDYTGPVHLVKVQILFGYYPSGRIEILGIILAQIYYPKIIKILSGQYLDYLTRWTGPLCFLVPSGQNLDTFWIISDPYHKHLTQPQYSKIIQMTLGFFEQMDRTTMFPSFASKQAKKYQKKTKRKQKNTVHNSTICWLCLLSLLKSLLCFCVSHFLLYPEKITRVSLILPSQ